MKLTPGVENRKETRETVRKLAEAGVLEKTLEAVTHLLRRSTTRAVLLQACASAFSEAPPGPWDLDADARTIIWQYVSGETHVATESPFWLCLTPNRQMELCGRFTLHRGRCAAGSMYVVINGTASLTGSIKELDDLAMLDLPILRPEKQPNDLRGSSHVFGCFDVDVFELMASARREARGLYEFMRCEIKKLDRPRKPIVQDEDEVVVERQAPMPALDAQRRANDDQKKLASDVMTLADNFDRNGLLSKAEIVACLTEHLDLKEFMLKHFHFFDSDSDGELALNELEAIVANFDAQRRWRETLDAVKPAPKPRRLDDEEPYSFGEDDTLAPVACDWTRDWTWRARRVMPSFTPTTEYLCLAPPESFDDDDELKFRDVLALRARGLGFLIGHASPREFEPGAALCDEGCRADDVLLTLSGDIVLSRLREIRDDAVLRAAVDEGLYFDAADIATLPAPVLLNDMPLVLGGVSLFSARAATDVRAVAVPAARFERLLRTHAPERQALRDSARLRAVWLEEARSRVESAQCRPEGRFAHLWSAAAVLTNPKDSIRWLRLCDDGLFDGVPASFFAGSVLSDDELAMLLHQPPTLAPRRSAAVDARQQRALVNQFATGGLGSFAVAGVYDTMPAPELDDVPIVEVKVPDDETLQAAASAPYLLPVPTATRDRRLHGCPLPLVQRDDTADPSTLRDLAKLHVARQRSGTATGKLRDAYNEIARHRALYDGVNADETAPAKFGKSAQDASNPPPVVLDGDHDKRLQTGMAALAGSNVAQDDRALVHEAIGTVFRALNAMDAAAPPLVDECPPPEEAHPPSKTPEQSSANDDVASLSARLRQMRSVREAAGYRREHYPEMRPPLDDRREHSHHRLEGNTESLRPASQGGRYFHQACKGTTASGMSPLTTARSVVNEGKSLHVSSSQRPRRDDDDTTDKNTG